MCYCDTSASAYTSAGPLSLKQNGVYTFVITSGCTDCPLRTQFTVSAATAGSYHTRSCCGAPTAHCGPALGQGLRHSSNARTCPVVSGPADRICLLRGSLGVSRINHILRVHGHTILQEKRAAEIYDEVWTALERLFPGFTEDSMT